MRQQLIPSLAAAALWWSLGTTAAHAQLANGGFESGLASWSTSGFVLQGYDYGIGDIAHQGTQAFYGGGIESPGFLFQNMPTVAGQDYVVRFWMQSDGYVPNQLTLRLGGVTMYTADDVLLQGFQQVQVGFRAAAATTELRFGLRNDSGFLRLDDITVTAVPEPAAALLAALGLAVLAVRTRIHS